MAGVIGALGNCCRIAFVSGKLTIPKPPVLGRTGRALHLREPREH